MVSILSYNYLRRSIAKRRNFNYSRFLSTLINENVAVFINKNNSDISEKMLIDVVNKDFSLLKNFITPEEETDLLQEVEKSFRRTRYEYDHWDGVRNLF